jgi:hypothetical protein
VIILAQYSMEIQCDKIYWFKIYNELTAAGTEDDCNLPAFIDKDYRSRSSATYSNHLGSLV